MGTDPEGMRRKFLEAPHHERTNTRVARRTDSNHAVAGRHFGGSGGYLEREGAYASAPTL